jgi:hypothetical protein
MTNGFDFQGNEVEAYGGSFGRWRVTGQSGREVGDLAFYGGVSGFAEDGWRELSPSNAQQVYADARWRGAGADSAFNLVYTNSNLVGNGPAPIQLLREDRSAIFTAPGQTKNALFGIATQSNFARHSEWRRFGFRRMRIARGLTVSRASAGSSAHRHPRKSDSIAGKRPRDR